MSTSINRKSNGSGTSVSFTIPLQITITIGTPIAVTDSEMEKAVESNTNAVSVIESASTSIESTAYSRFSSASLAATGFDWHAAIACADCSHLAYEEPTRVKDVCENQWRLHSTSFVQSGSTQCFVTATETAILVAFRGTKGALDWFSNLNMLERRTNFGSVHDGFYRAFQAVRSQLELLIEPLTQTRQLVLTGHSLGGALATIAAAQWHQKYEIRSVYTFGQPRVGFRSFQQFAAANLDNRFFRFVNADDIVPRVPPGYVHMGQLTRFDANGNVAASALESIAPSEPPSLSMEEFEAVKRSLELTGARQLESSQLEGLLPNYFSDHSMTGYLAKIMKNLPR